MKKLTLLITFTIALVTITYAAEDTSKTFLLDRIKEGREKLSTETVQAIQGVIGTKRVKVGRRKYKTIPIIGVIAREMALSIMGKDGAIRIVRAVKRNTELEVLTKGVVLSLRRENGINSDIVVVSPPGGKVLAVKYPISNERQRFGPGPAFIEAIYSPYSVEIKTTEIVSNGMNVLREFIEKAYQRLDERKVMSRAFPGKKVIDVIPRNVLLILLINEHIDPSEFTSPGLAQPLSERVLTIVSTNAARAYAYSISPAGARGLVQMIPGTYYRIANLYGAAGLMSNFVAGMSDPVNSVMAQVLLCDSDWEAIRKRAEIAIEHIGPYLAAAYNGGVGRVLSILTNDQEGWLEQPESNHQPTLTVKKRVPVRVRGKNGKMRRVYVVKSYTQPILRYETNKYVRQYHWIREYLEALNKPDTRPRTVQPALRSSN